MLVLLAALPYVGALAMYLLTTSELFRGARDSVPNNWNWRLVAPVLVGGLTPLALAADSSVSGTDRGVLLSVTGLAIIFTFISMGILREDAKYYELKSASTLGRRKFTRVPQWRLFVLKGAALLVYGAVVNVVIANG